jgi:hypothetical protein
MSENSELQAWLDDLEATQAKNALIIASLRERLGLEPGEGVTPLASPVVRPSNGTGQHHGPIRADTFFGLSIPEAIKKYLSIMKRPQFPKAIADALLEGGVLSQATNFSLNVNTALKRLRDSGVVVSTREGWGLAAWYPNRKQVETAPAKKKAAKKVAKKSKPVLMKAAVKKTHNPPSNTGWHRFLGEAAKEGKTMKQAAAEWKQRKAAV